MSDPTPPSEPTPRLCRHCGLRPMEDHPRNWTGMRYVVFSGRLRHHCTDGLYLEITRPSPEEAVRVWDERYGTLQDTQ